MTAVALHGRLGRNGQCEWSTDMVWTFRIHRNAPWRTPAGELVQSVTMQTSESLGARQLADGRRRYHIILRSSDN